MPTSKQVVGIALLVALTSTVVGSVRPAAESEAWSSVVGLAGTVAVLAAVRWAVGARRNRRTGRELNRQSSAGWSVTSARLGAPTGPARAHLSGGRRVLAVLALLANAGATGLAVFIPLNFGRQLGDAAFIHVNDMWTLVVTSAVAFVLNGILAYLVLSTQDS